jgi:hypothetical protein
MILSGPCAPPRTRGIRHPVDGSHCAATSSPGGLLNCDGRLHSIYSILSSDGRSLNAESQLLFRIEVSQSRDRSARGRSNNCIRSTCDKIAVLMNPARIRFVITIPIELLERPHRKHANIYVCQYNDRGWHRDGIRETLMVSRRTKPVNNGSYCLFMSLRNCN